MTKTITKDYIIAEIRRTAAANGGKPLGGQRFFAATGIGKKDWERYWNGLGEAQKEAGFQPNQFMAALPDEYKLNKLLGLLPSLEPIDTSYMSDIYITYETTRPDCELYRL